MASKELFVSGKPISSLRVVDLKQELEKRSLPKSGSKKDLLERLRLVSQNAPHTFGGDGGAGTRLPVPLPFAYVIPMPDAHELSKLDATCDHQ